MRGVGAMLTSADRFVSQWSPKIGRQAANIRWRACRYIVADRFDVTGARWSLTGDEAILKLRALAATATGTATGPTSSTRNATESTNPATSTAPYPGPREVPSDEPNPFLYDYHGPLAAGGRLRRPSSTPQHRPGRRAGVLYSRN